MRHNKMKLVLAVAALFTLFASPAFAGGGGGMKWRGSQIECDSHTICDQVAQDDMCKEQGVCFSWWFNQGTCWFQERDFGSLFDGCDPKTGGLTIDPYALDESTCVNMKSKCEDQVGCVDNDDCNDHDPCTADYCTSEWIEDKSYSRGGYLGNKHCVNNPKMGCFVCDTHSDCPDLMVCGKDNVCVNPPVTAMVGWGNECSVDFGDCVETRSAWGDYCVESAGQKLCQECTPDIPSGYGFDLGCSEERPVCAETEFVFPILFGSYNRPVYTCVEDVE